jgi:hypothetical protein
MTVDGKSYFRTAEHYLGEAEKARSRVDTVTMDRHLATANVYFTAAIAYALNYERVAVRSVHG